MLHALFVVLFTIPIVLIVGFICAFFYGYLCPHRVQPKSVPAPPRFTTVTQDEVAVLIACHNGEATIGSAVAAALENGVPVFVVSDASTDGTVARAQEAGATVLELTVNVGKPAALHTAYEHFDLSAQYRAITILDDDVIIAPDFVVQSRAMLTEEVAIAVGHNVTWWPHERRWNAWLAARAYSYWFYQLAIRRIQSAANVMNCISGSNSLYRTELLDQVLPERPPYIVDDTYWVLETHRRKLGRVVYAPKANALLQDPTSFRDWYKQNLRWMWGTFQGIIGHQVGRKATRFDAAYVLLMLHWLIYVLSGPATIWIMAASGVFNPMAVLILLGGHGLWMVFAAIRLRRPRLVLFIPALVIIDFIYRIILVHALVKAIRQPRVERCVWASPARIAT